MTDVVTCIEGRAGRITLNRPAALNALTWDMVGAITRALDEWEDNPAVALVMIDATGERAFCAGGDIAEMYARARARDFAYGRRFWADEYRMNARIGEYGKPVVSFLQGFTMGGGVGVGCHARLRIVGDGSRIAMPECSIGLVPDVGGSWLLARAPGRLGTYLGLTGARMGPGDAIHAGFADLYLPEPTWDDAKSTLMTSGDLRALAGMSAPAPVLGAHQGLIDHAFAAPDLAGAQARLASDGSDFARATLDQMARNAPLSMATTLAMLRNLGTGASLRDALIQENRVTWRAMALPDFVEGIRAAIIDKDRNPTWAHASADTVTQDEIAALLAPLGADDLTFDTNRGTE
jgi:enoyl-CoA hydratase